MEEDHISFQKRCKEVLFMIVGFWFIMSLMYGAESNRCKIYGGDFNKENKISRTILFYKK
ncbi:TPA: hypothetical protein ROY01_006242 [Bacillus toyonensis]|nr:hypothetical protein [Bacillus toyonensis]HDX9614969.1 hypothetical protein [Bacillus toyonensis]